MNHIRKWSPIGIALFLAVALTVILGSGVLAAVPANSGTTRITLMTKEISRGDNQSISVTAQLFDGDKPLGGQPVEFDMTANFFGDQQVNLGTVQTDATGTASLIYQPTSDGEYNFTAHFRGDGNHPHVEVARTITYSGPVTQYQPEEVGLTAVRQWITPIIYLGVGLFWLLLLVVGARTLMGISRAGKQSLVESQYKPYKHFGDVVYQKRSSRN